MPLIYSLSLSSLPLKVHATLHFVDMLEDLINVSVWYTTFDSFTTRTNAPNHKIVAGAVINAVSSKVATGRD